jgi:8-oxo-dGTP pyrophosphatase MutT (NUDIX family)
MTAPRGIDYVVGGYVVDHDRVLLLWHADLGRWVPAGGRIKLSAGEYPHEAVERKVREECGLSVRVVDFSVLTIADELASPLPAPAAVQRITLSPGVGYLDFVYLCNVIGGVLSLNYVEARAYHWFGADDLKRFPLVPHVRAFAQLALEYGQRNVSLDRDLISPTNREGFRSPIDVAPVSGTK